MVGIVQIFIFHKVGSGLDTEWYQAIIYVRCCCFPDLSHVNIQGVKHIQLVIMQRDLSLKTSNWNYKLNLTQYDFFTCVYPTVEAYTYVLYLFLCRARN